MAETRSTSGLQLLIAFATGAVAGAAVAYLTAPRSGKETREALQAWAGEARTSAARLPRAVRSAVDRGTHAAKEAFAESYREDASRSDS
jgi:gas vesicle protein